MGRKKSLSATEIAKIQVYHEQNLSNRAIAKKINRSPKVVNSYFRDPLSYGKNYKGRTSTVLSSRDKRKIVRLASNSTDSLSKIRYKAGVEVSRMTISRVIKSAGHLKRQKMKKKPPLNKVRKQQRLNFARSHMAWNTDGSSHSNDWRKVIFSDEKKFNLDGPDGYNYYFHDLRKEKLFLDRHHSREGGVMVWGAISYYGTIDLVFVNCRMTAPYYKTVLEMALPKFQDIFGPVPIIFQQDNAPIHTAGIIKAWLQGQNIEQLSWPPYSPDLNIIENVWGWLTRKVYEGGKQYKNKEELVEGIKVAWASISLDLLKSLYDSLKDRIFDVIQNKGGCTKY